MCLSHSLQHPLLTAMLKDSITDTGSSSTIPLTAVKHAFAPMGQWHAGTGPAPLPPALTP